MQLTAEHNSCNHRLQGGLDDPQRNGPDIILSVEGKPVKTEADLRNALKGEKPGSIVTLGIYNPRAQGKRVERIKLGDK